MISEIIQRFILASIESIPHLEAIMLLRHEPGREWSIRTVSQALYINEKHAEKILVDLSAIQVIRKHEEIYFYHPVPEGLKKRIDELADIYSKNLIEVTHLIHSKTNKQAQQFGDAFKWQQGKD